MARSDSSSARHHAIVIGGGLAGLLATRVLADHFDRVTMIERDGITRDAEPRKGVPQGHHVHGLLARGKEILTQLFPGLIPALLAGGAVSGDMGRDFRWHHYGVWKVHFDSGIGCMLFTRPFLESQIAERVSQLSKVRILQGTVDGLVVDSDHNEVTGVRIRPQFGDSSVLAADLTVDASGRGSRTPQWLAALGYATPSVSTVKVNVMYASRFYRPGPGTRDLKALLISPHAPDKKMAAIFAVEGNRWLVTLGGLHGVHPPTDEAGYLEFARSLPVPDVHQAISVAEPLTPIMTHNFHTNTRRHYDRLKSFPERFLVMGDALCSFNPIYGQGMTVSAREALALDEVLRERNDFHGLPARFHYKIVDIVDSAWGPTIGEDFRHKEAVGERPAGMSLIHWYTGRIHERCARDVTLALAFYRVMHMIDPPAALLRPSVMARALRKPLVSAQDISAARITGRNQLICSTSEICSDALPESTPAQ
jgi:2-polyprenyl-6-methoxyphenol hydroxylase-like FAD-dependent oxidoreductase